ncbi:hypothetical protein TWF225_009964 [Orbilia oligospora]|nr:hypothetical protein TWF751_011937 [Orbilia oligospora]KAF3172989.1 hypothetical protein TWF225_009964 [Orbilia oligospora]KAF3232654.1 hypothetical protein TWF128_003737 [Orbilia oligospora]KAF3237544.1 hypothetical protein TWF217_002069 [Orbilia oligospora]KAF3285856.1 hypothetical protein TWF132_009071 [Orbilia oligospora]
MFFPGDSRFLRSLELSHGLGDAVMQILADRDSLIHPSIEVDISTNTPLFHYIANTQMPLHSSHRYYEIHSYIRAENPENPEEEDSKISLP